MTKLEVIISRTVHAEDAEVVNLSRTEAAEAAEAAEILFDCGTSIKVYLCVMPNGSRRGTEARSHTTFSIFNFQFSIFTSCFLCYNAK